MYTYLFAIIISFTGGTGAYFGVDVIAAVHLLCLKTRVIIDINLRAFHRKKILWCCSLCVCKKVLFKNKYIYTLYQEVCTKTNLYRGFMLTKHEFVSRFCGE